MRRGLYADMFTHNAVSGMVWTAHLGDSLSAFGHGVLGQLTRQHQPHRRLNVL